MMVVVVVVVVIVVAVAVAVAVAAVVHQPYSPDLFPFHCFFVCSRQQVEDISLNLLTPSTRLKQLNYIL
jgi:hypothetical protein